ncbi:hypothetical protein [uncultured Rubinisphaera sp.]|uniref:hypothetical protein n=1 Tax=uncultured Rubinisphaera sp. TaxID=1678686 RepID=UPI0030D7CCDD
MSIQGQLKQGAAWLAVKIGRFKLNDSLLEYSDLSLVVELEAMLAVAQERIGLWVTLNSLTFTEVLLRDFVFLFDAYAVRIAACGIENSSPLDDLKGICW